MHVTVEHDGRLHAVEVKQVPGGAFVVTVDGVAADLDVRRASDGALSVRLEDGSTHLLHVERGAAPDQRVVAVDGVRVTTCLNGRRARRGAGHAGDEGQQRVHAPMPGKIVRVLTVVGAEVDARQPLVVVEAMKMENELSVPRGGRVMEILVEEGQSVEAGRLLVVVE
jgi:biotin carboxyl carrier protein